MPFKIEYIKEQDYILATFTGQITMAQVREYIEDLLPIIEETGCGRLLSDSTEAQLLFSSGDIMQFPKLAEESPLTANLKRAVLKAPGRSGYEMYETLSKIMGQQLQVFTDRQEALDWLLSDKPTNGVK